MLIKNEKYKAFLRGELFETIPREKFLELLKNISHKYQDQAKVMVILFWMTGARPNEILSLTNGDFDRKKNSLKVILKGSKGGKSRVLELPLKDELVQLVDKYVFGKHPEAFLFYRFRSSSKKLGARKKVWKKNSEGVRVRVERFYSKEYSNVSNRLYYWFMKWFEVPSYYYRHNRLSIAAEKLSVNDLMLLKGAKSVESVYPYLHMSEKTTKRIGKTLVN